jgi:TonB family protein
MLYPHRIRALATGILILALVIGASAQDPARYLGDKYQGKTLLLRGFYSSDRLRFDSSGKPDNATTGDWTTEGFVLINDIHFSHDLLVIKARRLVAVWIDRKQFELCPLENRNPLGKGKGVLVEIRADPSMHNPAPEQIDSMVSRIFLTQQDSLADLVPDYWKPCVLGGLTGSDKICAFSPEMVAVPGVISASVTSRNNGGFAAPQTGLENGQASGIFRVGAGVSPPQPIYQPEPAFSEYARQAKFEGTVVLMLVLNEEGAPTNIHVSRPLGYGLDEMAVRAVERWRFKPAKKMDSQCRFRLRWKSIFACTEQLRTCEAATWQLSTTHNLPLSLAPDREPLIANTSAARQSPAPAHPPKPPEQ